MVTQLFTLEVPLLRSLTKACESVPRIYADAGRPSWHADPFRRELQYACPSRSARNERYDEASALVGALE